MVSALRYSGEGLLATAACCAQAQADYPNKPLRPTVIVHDPDVPKEEAIILDLERDTELNISKSLRPGQLPSPEQLAALGTVRAGDVVDLVFVALAFFLLMSIASLTSSISMLEVPVSYVVENRNLSRHKAVWLIAGVIFAISVVIILNFATLFGLVIALTTRYSQPLLGLMLCIFAGWVWRRNDILQELKKAAMHRC